MKKIVSLLIVIVSIFAVAGCNANAPVTNNNSGENPSEQLLLTDEELINRTLYLFDYYVLPIDWWTGAGTFKLNVNEFGDPLENTPEGTAFHPVHRFNSIDEMKRATEQAVTMEYAEKNLYPNLDKHEQFLERDGNLYMNTEQGRGGYLFGPISAQVLSKTEDAAIMSVTFEEPYGEQEIHEIELKKENGVWKLNNYPYYEFDKD